LREGKSRRLASRLVVALLAVASAGCGGSGSSSRPAVGNAFQSKATTVCAKALAQKRAQGPFPYPHFNPTRPDRSKFPGIARVEAKTVTIYETWLRDMRALGQPQKGRPAWAATVRALSRNGQIIADQQVAARQGDSHIFTKDYYDGNKAQHDLENAANAAGLPRCNAAAAA
jgi:hypothetical protein